MLPIVVTYFLEPNFGMNTNNCFIFAIFDTDSAGTGGIISSDIADIRFNLRTAKVISIDGDRQSQLYVIVLTFNGRADA